MSGHRPIYAIVVLVLVSSALGYAQSVPLTQTLFTDGRQIRYTTYAPFTSWRMPDGSYLYVEATQDGTRKNHLVRVDPEARDYRYEATVDQSYITSVAYYRSTVRDSTYYTIIKTETSLNWSTTNTALYAEDLRTGHRVDYPLPESAPPKVVFTSIDSGPEMLVLGAAGSLYVVDKDLNWTRIDYDGLGITPHNSAPFVVYDRGDDHLIYVPHQRAFVYTHNNGTTWVKDSSLFTHITDATRDHATDEWYCTTSDGVFVVDSAFNFTRVDLPNVTAFSRRIQVHNGTIVLHDASGQDQTRYSAIWDRDQQSVVFTSSASPYWGDVSFTADGSTVVYGSGDRIISVSRDGSRDTVVRDHTTSMDHVTRLQHGSWLSGGRSDGLRHSTDSRTWNATWGDQLNGVNDIAASGPFVMVLDSAGQVHRSSDTGSTFERVEQDLGRALQVVHVSADTFALRYATIVAMVAASGSVFDIRTTTDTTAVLVASPLADVAVLLKNTDLLVSSRGEFIKVDPPVLGRGPTSICYDRDGRLWAYLNGFGPCWYVEDIDTWVPHRVNAMVGFECQLYRTLGNELVLSDDRYNPRRLAIWNSRDLRWHGLVDSLGEPPGTDYVVDHDHTSMYVSNGSYVRLSDPQWPDSSMGWVPYGSFERFVGLEPARAEQLISRRHDGPILKGHDGLHTFSHDLNSVDDQWLFSGSSVNPSQDNRTVLGLYTYSGPGHLVRFDVQTTVVDTVAIPDRDSVETMVDVAVVDGDTLWVSTAPGDTTTEKRVTLSRGIGSRHIIGTVTTSEYPGSTIFTSAAGEAGFLTRHFKDSLILNVTTESQPTTRIAIPSGATSNSSAVSGSQLAVVYQPNDTNLRYRLETYDLAGSPLQTRDFTRETRFQRPYLDYVADGRFLLVQTDSIYLVDPATLQTRAVAPRTSGPMESPLAYQDWILGTSYGEFIRWKPRGVALSIREAQRVQNTTPWRVFHNGSQLLISDPAASASVVYQVTSLSGERVWEGASHAAHLGQVASGLYLVTRTDRDRGTTDSKSVIVLR